ncbi:hypothetical protein, partial [Craterilacuibacter sp.]|uniref:hypothetical protein n=1 Tax=Craterilacuibacter sp. TaxID=2870909 RepID=UPI003F2FB859
ALLYRVDGRPVDGYKSGCGSGFSAGQKINFIANLAGFGLRGALHYGLPGPFFHLDLVGASKGGRVAINV